MLVSLAHNPLSINQIVAIIVIIALRTTTRTRTAAAAAAAASDRANRLMM